MTRAHLLCAIVTVEHLVSLPFIAAQRISRLGR
jgi:hypothetical protein